MKTTTVIIPVLIFIVLVMPYMESKAVTPMPPVFTIEQNAENILQQYPLGSISTQAAFAHHGSPVRKMKLPNGNNGWLYSIGEEAGVPNVYILQFSSDDIVIDVMHKSLHFKNGHTALQYQFLNKVTPELIMTGPGPGK